jgi:hypothetical protein
MDTLCDQSPNDWTWHPVSYPSRGPTVRPTPTERLTLLTPAKVKPPLKATQLKATQMIRVPHSGAAGITDVVGYRGMRPTAGGKDSSSAAMEVELELLLARTANGRHPRRCTPDKSNPPCTGPQTRQCQRFFTAAIRRAGDANRTFLAEPPRTSNRTNVTPADSMLRCDAAARDKSMILPLLNGPRSLIRTITDLPDRTPITRTRVPKRREGCAAVNSPDAACMPE